MRRSQRKLPLRHVGAEALCGCAQVVGALVQVFGVLPLPAVLRHDFEPAGFCQHVVRSRSCCSVARHFRMPPRCLLALALAFIFMSRSLPWMRFAHPGVLGPGFFDFLPIG